MKLMLLNNNHAPRGIQVKNLAVNQEANSEPDTGFVDIEYIADVKKGMREVKIYNYENCS